MESYKLIITIYITLFIIVLLLAFHYRDSVADIRK